MPKVFIVIPAFNEEKTIETLIKELISKYPNYKIIISDDGSTDNTAKICNKYDVVHIQHAINRGAGAATKTGFEYAKLKEADILVTMDADGQHAVLDIPNLISPILKDEYDVSIGSRLIDRHKMPILRRFFNFLGNLVTFAFFGIYLHDTQSGFKAFNKKAITSIDFQSDGFEFCSEIIREIRRNNLKFVEVPIHTIYTDYSLSKGQSLMRGFSMLFKLFFGK